MQLIPVIDLMGGQVVRAVGGQRALYRPVVSRLCAGSAPVTVARALCRHAGADTLYVADLDALTGGAVQIAAVHALLAALPGLTVWLDAGFRSLGATQALTPALGRDAARVVPVLGSETLANTAALEAGFGPGAAGRQQAILSLDRRGPQRLDAADCWLRPDCWPERLIVMTLERVGSAAGPDLDCLRQVRAQAPQVWLVGAGGVRDDADLQAAEAAGADAWLVASALHDGRLCPRENPLRINPQAPPAQGSDKGR